MTGGNPQIMTHSHPKHGMYHEQYVAEITLNMTTHDQSDGRLTTQLDAKRGDFEWDVPG